MQRKSNLLKTYNNKKNGIAMLLAIAFLIITAVLMAIMVNMTALSTKRTTDIFFQEQAQLLAKSATEFTLLAISAHDRGVTGNCVTDVNIQYPGAGNLAFYDINTTIQYIGLNCPANSLVNTVATPESDGTVIIDTYVSSSTNVRLSEPVRFHRRTMQKL